MANRKATPSYTYQANTEHSAPDRLDFCIVNFCQWMTESHYSKSTIDGRRACLHYFRDWCFDRGIVRAVEVTRPVIERYKRYLFHYRKEVDNQPLSIRSQHSRLEVLRALFRWLVKSGYVLYNPAADIDLPRLQKHLPRHVLTEKQMERVLQLPDTNTDMGVRDRALLELMYSTGMRRMEVTGLTVYDIHRDRGTIFIQDGKGGKDRVVPLGDRALSWLDRYCFDVRPQILSGPDSGAIFLGMRGSPISANRIGGIVRSYMVTAGITQKGSCHLMRHTMATHMLENGADIRFIQHMLGHVSLNTTQIYTHVSIKQLKQVHSQTHPTGGKRPGKANKSD